MTEPSSLPQQSDGGTYEYPAEVVHERARQTRAMVLENKRLRWALEEACDTAWSDGPAAMASLLRKAADAIPETGTQTPQENR